MKLELHATPDEVIRAVEAIEKFGREKHLDEKTTFALSLALEECGSNIVNHGLQRDAQQTFQIAFEYTGDAVRIELRDRGPAFDPTRVELPSTAADDRPPGGLGIELVRRFMDDILYRRDGAENVLVLRKRIVPHAGEK